MLQSNKISQLRVTSHYYFYRAHFDIYRGVGVFFHVKLQTEFCDDNNLPTLEHLNKEIIDKTKKNRKKNLFLC